MRAVLPLLLVTGCAAIGDDWPTLAMRPAERGGLPAAEASAPEPGAVMSAAPAASEADVRRDLAAASHRWDAQRAALERALPGKGTLSAGSERWAEAQVELSRLEVIGNELDDIAARAAAVPDSPALEAEASAAVERHRVTALAARNELDR